MQWYAHIIAWWKFTSSKLNMIHARANTVDSEAIPIAIYLVVSEVYFLVFRQFIHAWIFTSMGWWAPKLFREVDSTKCVVCWWYIDNVWFWFSLRIQTTLKITWRLKYTYGRDVVGYCQLRLTIRCRHPAPGQDSIPLQRLHVFAHSRDPHPAIKLWCQVPFTKSKKNFKLKCIVCSAFWKAIY